MTLKYRDMGVLKTKVAELVHGGNIKLIQEKKKKKKEQKRKKVGSKRYYVLPGE
jgi:hypothetical protein